MGVMFGTDGVRGVANRDLSPLLAFKIGRAGAHVLARQSPNAAMVIGRDTRISGDMLEAALVAGICSAGVDVLKVGVMPTPAVAYLTRKLEAAAGVVISASHNPVDDNGIKFFGATGYKLSDEVEAEIEALVMDECAGVPWPTGGRVGRVRQVGDAADLYVKFACSTAGVDLSGLKIVVDCANGAAYQVAPRVYSRLGAEVVPIFNRPDGININDGCGSTHPEALMEAVVSEKADLGLAHDGDADRVLAVDADGRLVDGDQIMVICARSLHEKGLLANETVVVTVMSNLGLHLALRESGIRVVQTKVGDRYVLEELLRNGARFGGEQSGHIIFLDHNTTGDGILTALQLLSVIKETGKPLKELAGQMERLPQLLENVRVADKALVMNSPVLAEAIEREERLLEGMGRILVRPSGTEPLVRVMAEGKNMGQLKEIVGRLVNIIKEID
ncbi:MAG: phosphoglucosamine mutase [Pelotomaculum sp.]|uniref:Phosphoglucosamine mutase n=1 Tax=Pelotomaculum thermopropionicum (strain DSM 13744 / JCM 10971 / SI) TaxID=370438 RepID=GLMM_PELTS|nr:RecName: Full=Phosphoglucosamine mutase [Pelotomaculum thermopropionicum SI]NPV73434.1 phosphoglucosamine mutase [Pelotomaculum sp.]BAF58719.1 phosphomannomutase [Pelotomaculum thermopropionicum SI]